MRFSKMPFHVFGGAFSVYFFHFFQEVIPL